MKILVNDEIDTDLWEEFVSGNPHANPFQTPAFYELVNHAIPSSGQAVCVFDHGKIRALAVVFLQKEKIQELLFPPWTYFRRSAY